MAVTVVLGASFAACQAHLEQLPILYDDDDTPGDDDTEDADGDGFSVDEGDCDDGDPSVHPMAADPCDDVDHDCDGELTDSCTSCAEMLAGGVPASSGNYALDLDGDPLTPPVETHCEMTIDGGGWTLIMRTTDDWDLTQALITDYATFRSTTLGDPDTVFRVAGELWPALADDGDLLMVVTPRLATGDACEDSMAYEVTGLELDVPASGPAVASGYQQDQRVLNDATLSTTDSGPAIWCVTSREVAPWFLDSAICGDTNPSFRHPSWWPGNNPRVSYLQSSPDLQGRLADDVCSGTVDAISGYLAATDMAFYLR